MDYGPDDVVDEDWARRILGACGVNFTETNPYAMQYATLREFAERVTPSTKAPDKGATDIVEAINALAKQSLVRPALVRQSRPLG